MNKHEKLLREWLTNYLKDVSQSRSIYRKRKGKLTVSMAGRCYEMHYYAINGYEKELMDFSGLYATYVGTMLHRMIQGAIATQQENVAIQDFRIDIPEFNVLGELDLALIDQQNKHIKLYDFKVLGNYSWKKKTKEKEPSKNYEYQVLTYRYGLKRLFKDYEIEPYLIFIKRETGSIKTHLIDIGKEEEVLNYWKEVNQYIETRTGKPLIGEYPTPIEEWECKYCPFNKYCIGGAE